MPNYVTTAIDANGRLLLIEPESHPRLDRRCFRQIGDSYEWCHYSDFRANGPRARFYGYASKELPASMTT